MASADTAPPITAGEVEALFADLRQARGIVAAVSGGPDSTCLMHLLAAWRGRGERPPVIVNPEVLAGR